jgi:MoaA/NifB/PqqE/SkfB family radical SAM enzyme
MMPTNGQQSKRAHIKRWARTLLQSPRQAPGQLVLQLTDRCNAHCPQCGMRVSERFERALLDDDTARRTIDAAAQRGIQVLSFTGGEPLLVLDRLVDLINYAGSRSINYIRTGTNGFQFCGAEKPGFERRVHAIAAKLAKTPLRNFWISIDSVEPDVHENIRGLKGLFAGIEKAVAIFHQYNLYPSANLGINRLMGGPAIAPLTPNAGAREQTWLYHRFKRDFGRFYRRVSEMGFTIANVCYPMSYEADCSSAGNTDTAIYQAASVDNMVRFSPAEKALLFKALLDVIPEHRPFLRLFTPRCALYALQRTYVQSKTGYRSYPCRGGIDFFFVDAHHGNLYPCGYRGDENLGKLWERPRNGRRPKPYCRRCDWECFRDPSELSGPFLEAIINPAGLMKRIAGEGEFFRLWTQDLNYYRACDFFDGRKPPRRRLQRYGRRSIGPTSKPSRSGVADAR